MVLGFSGCILLSLTFFRVGDLHYGIWSIILGNRLQICPFLPVPEIEIN